MSEVPLLLGKMVGGEKAMLLLDASIVRAHQIHVAMYLHTIS